MKFTAATTTTLAVWAGCLVLLGGLGGQPQWRVQAAAAAATAAIDGSSTVPTTGGGDDDRRADDPSNNEEDSEEEELPTKKRLRSNAVPPRPTTSSSSSSFEDTSSSLVVKAQKKADDLARIVDEVNEESNYVGSDAALEEAYQELQAYQASVMLETVAIAKASISEKLAALSEAKDSYAILADLVSHLKNSNFTHMGPILQEVEKQVQAIDFVTGDFIQFVLDNNKTAARRGGRGGTGTGGRAPPPPPSIPPIPRIPIGPVEDGNTKLNIDYKATAEQWVLFQKDQEQEGDQHRNQYSEDEGTTSTSTTSTAGDDAMVATPPTSEHDNRKHKDNRTTSASSSTHKKRHVQNKKTDEQEEDDDQEDTEHQHWHGFKTHSHYRAWKKSHTSAHPRVNHVFDTLEHVHTGQFGELRSKTIRRNEFHLNRWSAGGGGRRRLSTTELDEQCDILSKCSSQMSMYDLIFYHFSDYIDTTTGIFADNFRIPKGFDLFKLRANIRKANDAVKFGDKKGKAGRCRNLLDLFHWNRATAKKDYFAWEGGIVSEVCYASGTTKLIDMYLIRENLGTAVAATVFYETKQAAEALFKSPNVNKLPSEEFLYKDGKFPIAVNGPETEKGREHRPNRVIDTNKFYKFADSYTIDFSPAKMLLADRECPKGRDNGGIGPTGLLQCGMSENYWYPKPPPIAMKYLVVLQGRVSSAYATLDEANVYMRRFYFLRLLHNPGMFLLPLDQQPLHIIVEVDGSQTKKAQDGFHNLGGDKEKEKQADLEEEYLNVAKTFVDQTYSGEYSELFTVVEYWFGMMWLDGLYYHKEKAIEDATRSSERKASTAIIALNNVNVDTWNLDEISKELGLGADPKEAMTEAISSLPICASPRDVKDPGHTHDEYAGWYDVYGCGQCNFYCRWLGTDPGKDYPTFYDPSERLEMNGGLYWSCATVRSEDDKSFPRPFTFKRCHGIDALLNSTKIVFGDVTPGQIAALAGGTDFNKQQVDLTTWCPEDWKRQGFKTGDKKVFSGEGSLVNAGFACQKPTDMSTKDAMAQCLGLGGRWNDEDSESCKFGGCPDMDMDIGKQYLSLDKHGEKDGKGEYKYVYGRWLAVEVDVEKGMIKCRPGTWYDHDADYDGWNPSRERELDCTVYGMVQGEFTNTYNRADGHKGGITNCYASTKLEVVEASTGTMPGYCCLDDADVSGVWGEPYHCSERCKHYGPALSGLSTSTCDLFGGTWCQGPTDCTKLQECMAKYLVSAEDKTNADDYNPVFAEYLAEAPQITDVTDPFQCGQAREYFGHDATFNIDGRICHDVWEYRNSKDLNFMNEVFKSIPTATGADSTFPGIAPGGGGSTEDDADKVVAYEISTIELKSLEEADSPEGGCDGDTVDTFTQTIFALTTIFDTVEANYEAITTFECPEDITGAVKTACALGKNLATIIMAIAKVLSVTVLELAQNIMDTICEAISPYDAEESMDQVKAIYKNSEIAYKIIARREEQTHEGLNSISAQLPKLDAKLDAISEELSSRRHRDLVGTNTASSYDGAQHSDTSADVHKIKSDVDQVKAAINGMKEDMKAMKDMKEDMKAMKDMMMDLLGAMNQAGALAGAGAAQQRREN